MGIGKSGRNDGEDENGKVGRKGKRIRGGGEDADLELSVTGKSTSTNPFVSTLNYPESLNNIGNPFTVSSVPES